MISIHLSLDIYLQINYKNRNKFSSFKSIRGIRVLIEKKLKSKFKNHIK